jgi:hypothetical protein
MQHPPGSRGGAGSYVLPAMLMAAIVLGVLLSTRLFGGSDVAAVFSVGEAVGTPCPAGAGVPSCVTFEVLNVGRSPGGARCTLESSEGAPATFAEGGVVVETPAVIPGSAVTLLAEIDVGDDGTVWAPLIACEPSS